MIPNRYYWLVGSLLLLIPVFFSVSSCGEKDQPAKITILFEHFISDKPLKKDSLGYINASGNRYEVNELQYFISELVLWKSGEKYKPDMGNGIHYVDIDLPLTLNWYPETELPSGKYDSITMTLGLNEVVNQTGLFVNPPERDMFWPDMMGGGYHYMKMNGKWMSEGNLLEPFNLHLGIGMKEDSFGNEQFFHNYFSISLPLDDCYLDGNQLYNLFILRMDLNSWFETPNSWNWDEIGGQIMQNQDAMHLAARNGADVFTVTFDSAYPK
jgi:hypothetical protein